MKEIKLLRLPDVRKFAGNVGQSTIYSWVKQGKFPKPLKPTAGVALWRAEDLEAWATAAMNGGAK